MNFGNLGAFAGFGGTRVSGAWFVQFFNGGAAAVIGTLDPLIMSSMIASSSLSSKGRTVGRHS